MPFEELRVYVHKEAAEARKKSTELKRNNSCTK